MGAGAVDVGAAVFFAFLPFVEPGSDDGMISGRKDSVDSRCKEDQRVEEC